jgi:hypothetical protein
MSAEHMPNEPIERAIAAKELSRINATLASPHLLIGGLAVQQYHVARTSHDIDLVCSFAVAQSLLTELYPSGSWRIEDKRRDDYRPAYEITHRFEQLGTIKFGPKIAQREPYEHINWSALIQRSRPYVGAEGELPNIRVPSPDGLAFTKLISFVSRLDQEKKARADLADFVDLTNHNAFSASHLLDLLRGTGMCDELMSRFRRASRPYREIVEDSCLFSLSQLFHLDQRHPFDDSAPSIRGDAAATLPPVEAEIATPPAASPETSTVFFHDRMSDAFPGATGLHRARNYEEGLARLSELLKEPLTFERYAPIWKVGHGHMGIVRADLSSLPIIRIGHHRYVMGRVVGHRSLVYWRDFVLLEWTADEPTGLYEAPPPDKLEEYASRLGAHTEEYGVWEGGLATRLEHDDGRVFRNGQSVQISSRLEVRHLTSGFTVSHPRRASGSPAARVAREGHGTPSRCWPCEVRREPPLE